MFTIRNRAVLAALVGAVSLTCLGAAATPAAAAIGPIAGTGGGGRADLSVARNIQRYTVRVKGLIRMTQAEAQSLIASDHRVVWRLWGEDVVYDDFLFGPDPATVTATSQGLEFDGSRVVPGSTLNEDPEGGNDELYAGIRLVKGYINGKPGPTVRSGESDRFVHDF